ncbi:hypothetical protein AYO41_01285 [Verrucomicrobia bacterium SCGC AG-212-E04]|nr:hypothetical protein AYO41_01285 [Verrucomicrobia bacterium SCGC AG-212-E04]
MLPRLAGLRRPRQILAGSAVAVVLAFLVLAPWRTIGWVVIQLAAVTGFTAVMMMAAQAPRRSPAPDPAQLPSPSSSSPPPEPEPEPERDVERKADSGPEAAAANARFPTTDDQLAAANDALRQYQRALAESRGLATLGRLVDASTHETNNRLGTAILAISSLRDKIAGFTALYKANQLTRSEFDRFLESSAEAGEVVQTNLRRAADLVAGFKQLAADQADRRRRSFELKSYLETVAHAFELAHRHNGHQVRIEGCEVSLNHRPGSFSKLFCELVLLSLDWSVADRTNARIRMVITTTPTAVRLDYCDNGRQIPPGVTGASTLQNLAGIDAPLPEIMELISVVREELGGTISFGTGPNGFGNLIRIELPKTMITGTTEA